MNMMCYTDLFSDAMPTLHSWVELHLAIVYNLFLYIADYKFDFSSYQYSAHYLKNGDWRASLVAQLVKNSSAMQETWVWPLD